MSQQRCRPQESSGPRDPEAFFGPQWHQQDICQTAFAGNLNPISHQGLITLVVTRRSEINKYT